MNNNFDSQFNNQNIHNNTGVQGNQQSVSNNLNVGQNVNCQQFGVIQQNSQQINPNNQNINNSYGQQQMLNQNIVNNTYQGGENVQNPVKQKKFNIWFVIIPIIIVATGVIVYFTFFNDKESKPIDGQTQNSGTNNTINKNDKVVGWDDYSLFIDGKEIKLPMKFSDFQALGFYEMDTYNDSILTSLCEENSNCGSTYDYRIGNTYGLFTNGTTNNIELVIYNPYDERKQLKDCYVTGVGFEINQRNNNENIQVKLGQVKMVNNTRKVEAIMGKTKYEDIEILFGPHYQYDYSNTLTYYPDSKLDGIIGMDDLNVRRHLHMYFDNDTRIFEQYDFYYFDMGDLEKK